MNQLRNPVSDFNEFKPRLKSPQNRFQLSAGLNLETLNTNLSGTKHIQNLNRILDFETAEAEFKEFEPRPKFKPRLKFFKFALISPKF